MTEIVVILILLIFNGIFAMSEAAVIATRKARLQPGVERGDKSAQAALELVEEPNRFLSTVQIGITLIGILAGVLGGATVEESLAGEFEKVPFLVPYAEPLSFALVVLVTTYLSLIIGELVPKRLALRNPEKIAMLVAVPMRTLSKLAAPAVNILSASTNAALWLLGVRGEPSSFVTAAEITAMIQQGVDAGVFHETDQEMVEGVFSLKDRRVRSLMTPRTEVDWLNLDDGDEVNMAKIIESKSTRFPVCDGEIDDVVGIVNARDLFARSLQGLPFDLRAPMMEPIFVPETLLASRVMEIFRQNTRQLAIVVGEHGGVEGVVTVQDLLDEIVGEIDEAHTESEAVRRDDGSWLLDGLLPIHDFKELLLIDVELPGEHHDYETVGGFIMAQLGRIPASADKFEWQGYAFEVMDMDGNRVDKVLVVAPKNSAKTDAEEGQ